MQSPRPQGPGAWCSRETGTSLAGDASLYSINHAPRQAHPLGPRPRRRHQIEAIHRLGPRVLDELLDEIGVECGITTLIERKVERYAALDPEAIRLTGGDRFPPLPIHEVRP